MDKIESKSHHLSVDNENHQFNEIKYLEGEVFQALSREVSYLCPYFGLIIGTITVTNYKLYFKSTVKNEPQMYFDVPLCTIQRIEKFGGVSSKGENSYGFELICKDMWNFKFMFSQENHSRRDIIEKLQIYAFPNSQNSKIRLFAFEYSETFAVNGWEVYDAVSEFKRLGIDSDTWRITYANENYELCDSYPAILAVPISVLDDDLRAVANFRFKNRLPVLSWIHKGTQASITRASQPQVGVSGKRSKDDEHYLQSIIDANAESSKLYIMDARPSANAIANKARGGGTESEDVYSYAEIIFLDIPNIHIVRDSLKKLKELCYPRIEENRFLSCLEQTNWLKYIKLILNGAIRIAEKIYKYKSSVLVHCSDGWDRTSQLTSLSMILLDPFYRTIIGFEILIEKEWLSFGHKFNDRIGHGDEEVTKERSPQFVQFIDCVFQIKNQFTNAFEFRDNFLIAILDHLYSCRFGTFLCNTEKERHQLNLKQNTVSLWSYINSNIDLYKNPCYHQVDKIIKPIASQRILVLWKNYYFARNPTCKKNQDDEKYKRILLMKEQLQKYAAELRQKQALKISQAKSK